MTEIFPAVKAQVWRWEELSGGSSSHMACRPWLLQWWWPCLSPVPSLSSSPTTIMTGQSSRGCISSWVQRASVPRKWPVFVPFAPLHSGALCSSVRPGWVIKKARPQVVIISGLSKTDPRQVNSSAPPRSFLHCAAPLPHRLVPLKSQKTLPANTWCTVNSHDYPPAAASALHALVGSFYVSSAPILDFSDWKKYSSCLTWWSSFRLGFSLLLQ